MMETLEEMKRLMAIRYLENVSRVDHPMIRKCYIAEDENFLRLCDEGFARAETREEKILRAREIVGSTK